MKGLPKADALAVDGAVAAHGEAAALEELWRRIGASVRALASADAIGLQGLSRQAARWAAQRLREESLPLFDGV